MGLSKRVIIGGLVVVAVIGAWVASNAWSSDEPWWTKGNYERLRVFTCDDTDCKKENHGLHEVVYRGQFYTHYTQSGTEDLIDTAKEGLSYVSDSALSSWQNKMDLNTKDKDRYDYIYKFTLYLKNDRETGIDAYGYCYSRLETKECIVFSNSTQYRIQPENNDSF